jgi:tetrapyrrole methylase family protein/MazG family protein
MIDLTKCRYDFDDLADVMRTLRSPEGCPWDREQSLETLKAYCIEEAGEVCAAIDRVLSNGGDDDWAELCEELGDLLLQVVFQARIAEEEGRFTLDDVVNSIVKKLIRRHPHVFGDTRAETSDEVLANWKVIKQAETTAKEMGGELTPEEAEGLLHSSDDG